MEKKQKDDVLGPEIEEIFHPDFVEKKPKNKKRFRGILGHWFGLLLVIIISIIIFYCLTNLWTCDRISAKSADGILQQLLL